MRHLVSLSFMTISPRARPVSEHSTRRIQVRGWRIAVAILSCGLSAAAPASAGNDDVSAVLLAKTWAFSDAGPLGQGPAMAALVDERVTFFNENGDQATKADLAAISPTPSGGVVTRMSVTDWSCQDYGNVAVTGFIDTAARTDSGGRTTFFRYRSVETWLRRGKDWVMIGSETVALPGDPGTVPLTNAADFAGTYSARSGQTAEFTVKEGKLLASINGQPAVPQEAEAPDMLFTPGEPRIVRIFRRNAQGRIVGFIAHRTGQNLIFDRVD